MNKDDRNLSQASQQGDGPAVESHVCHVSKIKIKILKKREKHIRLDLFLVAAVGRNLTLYSLNLVLKNARKEKSNHKTRIKLLVLSSPICL